MTRLPWMITAVATAILALAAAIPLNLLPATVIGKDYLFPVGFGLSLVGMLIAPLPALGIITTIGAIKFDRLLALPEGLDWTMIIACALAILMAVRVVTDTDPREYPRALLILALLFASLWLASVTWSSSPLYGGVKALAFVLVTGAIAAGPAIYLRIERHWWWYFATIMGVALVVCVEILRHAASDEISRSAFGGSYLGSARVIGLGILLAITTVLIRPGMGLWTLVALVGCAIGVVAMLKSGARGPLLSLAGTLIFLASISWRMPSVSIRRRLRWIAICMPAGALLALLLFPDTFETILVRGALLVTMNGDSINSRVERIGIAQHIWASMPLFGGGSGSFNWAFGWGEKIRGAYPHNLFLETLSETGLVGATLLLLIMAWATFTAWTLLRHPGAHPWIIPVIGLLFYSTMNAMVSGDLNSNRGVFASLGLLVALLLRTTYQPGVPSHATHLHH